MQDQPDTFNAYHRWLGIAPKHQPPDHYRLLGIERFESDPEVIRDATERQMVHVRRYQLGQYSELSQKILNELGAAKACLSNPVAKAAYDQALRRPPKTSTLKSAPRSAETPSVAVVLAAPVMVLSDPAPLSEPSPHLVRPELPIQAVYRRRRVPIAKPPSPPFRKLMVALGTLGVVTVLAMSLLYVKTQREGVLAKQEQDRVEREQREKQERLVQLELKRDRVQNAQKTAQEVRNAADAAFQTKVRTAAYEQGKRLFSEGTRAMEAAELDAAEQLFGQSSQSFAKSLAEAPAVNELGKAQKAWTGALATADKELLKKYAREQFAAAQEKAAAAEKQVAAEKFQEGMVLYREAADVLTHARAEVPGSDVAREHQQRWAKQLKIPAVQANSIGMEMVLIPAGEFLMGSPEGEKDSASDQHPQHPVQITKPFYMAAYTVTQGEYQRVMGSNPSCFSASGKGGEKVLTMDTSRFPVEQVSWEEAVGFCRKLSALPEEQAAGRAYRLPTEAEWEYACRAGSSTPFHFGSVLNGNEANCDGNYPYGTETKGQYLGRTTAVGSYRPNAFGLFDMHGNVRQWCQDWYGSDYYANSPTEDPTGPSTASNRVARGGSWDDYAGSCPAAHRGNHLPDSHNPILGFRVALIPAGVKHPQSEFTISEPKTTSTTDEEKNELSTQQGQPSDSDGAPQKELTASEQTKKADKDAKQAELQRRQKLAAAYSVQARQNIQAKINSRYSGVKAAEAKAMSDRYSNGLTQP